MASRYQAEFRFAIGQSGIVRRIERVIFPAEPEADGDLRAVEELAGRAALVAGMGQMAAVALTVETGRSFAGMARRGKPQGEVAF